MNGNRSRYSVNPTFSANKRGLFKKNAQSFPDKPNFTAVPENTAAQQNPFVQQPNAPVQPVNGPSYPPAADLFSPIGGQPGITNMNPMGLTPMQPQMQQPFAGQNPYVFQNQPIQNMPPLGNQPGLNQMGTVSPHQQGFMPPQTGQQPCWGGANQAQPARTNLSPAVQPAGYGIPSTFDPSIAAQQQMGYGQNGFGMQQNGYPQNPPSQGQPMDADTLWKLFLFVLLPVLFIPCLFVPPGLNVLRYVFLALCVAGIGVVWYRKMFTPNTRIIVTLGCAAAFVTILVMMFMGGSADLQKQTPNGVNQQQQTAQNQHDNQNGAAVAQPTFSPTPEPTATPAPVSEAQNRLEAFMTYWSGAKIEDMVKLVQPSWVSTQDNPSNRLFVMLGNRTPLAYNIEEISGSDSDSSRTVTMTANIDKNNGKDPTLYRFMVLMVKEGGEWYIDPNSLATNDEVENKEETAVVNDSQSKAAEEWVLPPRQTVTPAPAGSQLLYYNPDGGSMYHMDQNCPSIRDEYLPLQGSFPYSELGSYRNLTPCLKCNAPTQTLPPDNSGDGL